MKAKQCRIEPDAAAVIEAYRKAYLSQHGVKITFQGAVNKIIRDLKGKKG